MGILKLLVDFTTAFKTADDNDLTKEQQAELNEILKKEGNTELLRLIDKKGEKRREKASEKIAEKQEIEKNTERKDEEREN